MPVTSQIAIQAAASRLCAVQKYYIFPLLFYPHACKSCSGKETRVVLLTVHRCKGVCFAVNIHWIAKERQIINWSRRFAFLSRMKMWRRKKRWFYSMEGLSLPLHPRFSNRSNGNFFPLKVALLFFNSPVLQRRSGRCKAWPKDCFRNTTCAQFIGIFSKPGVTRGNSHSMPASKLGLFYRNETFRFQCAGPGISFSPGGFDSHVKTAKGTCAYAHTHKHTHVGVSLSRWMR